MAGKRKRRYGQHFLIDENIIQNIMDNVSPLNSDYFFEIGCGRGAITYPIARACKSLQALEIDPKMINLTSKHKDFDQLQIAITQGDILNTDLSQLLIHHTSYRLIGNLPYNISTEIIFRLIEHRDKFKDAHIMVQKEVADRLLALPNSKKYGRLTIFSGLWLTFEKLFDIYPDSFSPPPLVDSTFLRVKFLDDIKYKIHDMKKYRAMINQAFSMRRKTIAKSLSNLITRDELIQIGIDPMARPENISPNNFVILANYLAKLADQHE
jgi:16S rRNA (adenine1518-N6/adenine1519-N6)-dimethyltransferase